VVKRPASEKPHKETMHYAKSRDVVAYRNLISDSSGSDFPANRDDPGILEAAGRPRL